MKQVYKKVLFVFGLLLLSIFYSMNVEAKTNSTNVCLSNGSYYTISWDDTVSTAVNASNINSVSEADITSGYLNGQIGNNQFRIFGTYISGGCYISNGKILSCPTSSESIKYSPTNLTITDENNKYKYIAQEPNVGNATYTIKIKDVYGGKVKIRYVPNESNLNINKVLSTQGGYQFIEHSNGYFYIRNVSPSTDQWVNKITLELYVDDPSSKCNNSYIGGLEMVVNQFNYDTLVDNPARNNNNYCGEVNNYVNSLLSKVSVNKSSFESLLKNQIVYLCYDKKITYRNYIDLNNKINEQFNNLKESFKLSDYENVSKGNDTASASLYRGTDAFCDNGSTKVIKNVDSYSGAYYGYTCDDTYETVGDGAKLVYAGGGFKYQAKFKVKRTCTIFYKPQISTVTTSYTIPAVKKAPQCVYTCETLCAYVEDSVAVPDTKAGPNEEFDSCVKTCDGGKYSQSCINSCYNQVYKSNRKLDDNTKVLEKYSLSFNNDKVKKMVTIVATITSSAGGTYYETTKNGNVRYMVDVPTPHCGTVGVIFSKYCDTNSGICVVYEIQSPAGCSDTPILEYNTEISSVETEFQYVAAEVTSELNTGDYTIRIADSYLNNNGKAYVYEINSWENPEILSITEDSSSCDSYSTWNIGDQGDQVGGCRIASKTKEVTISLPTSYLSKIDGTAAYNTGTGIKSFDTVNYSSDRLAPLEFNAKNYYSGGKRYYTNVLSKDTNVNVSNNGNFGLISYGAYKSDSNKKASIAVSVTGWGDGEQSAQVDCFYGVYNDTIQRDGDGIQFIFRPIELKDVFPNDRNPRWNWTNDATPGSTNVYNLLNYKVSPVELTEQIQEKDKKIYSDNGEVDYEFTLDPQTIKKIRSYNKKEKSYGKDITYVDYDMNCTTYNGRSYCYSEFLDNYLKLDNMTNTERHNIAVCNNTYSGKCSN